MARTLRQRPAVIGTTVQLSGVPYEIVGIAPAGFADPIAGDVDVWLPHSPRARYRDTSLEPSSDAAQPASNLERLSADCGLSLLDEGTLARRR